MEIHFPKPSHVNQMKQLWSICFGDTVDYIDFYYNHCYKSKNTMIAIEDGKVVAMLTSLPTVLNTEKHIYKGSYIYAVATHPDYRNRGYMRQLDYAIGAVAEYRGDKFMALVPATSDLFPMYEKLGYKNQMQISQKIYSQADVTEENIITNVNNISDKHFIPLRQHYVAHLGNSVHLDGYYLDYWYKELCKVGCKFISVQNKYGQGYLVYHYDSKDKKLAIVREAGLSINCFKSALPDILTKLNVKRIAVNTNENFDKGMTTRKYGMIKYLDDKLKSEIKTDIYMNLMLD